MTKTEPLGLTRGEPVGLTRGEPVGLTRGEPVGLTRGEPVGLTRGEPVGLTDAGVNYLYIYEGETLLLRQVSDAVAEVAGEAGEAGAAGGGEFGSPSLVLDYGTHALTFVASDFELDDTDNQVRSEGMGGSTNAARAEAALVKSSVWIGTIGSE